MIKFVISRQRDFILPTSCIQTRSWMPGGPAGVWKSIHPGLSAPSYDIRSISNFVICDRVATATRKIHPVLLFSCLGEEHIKRRGFFFFFFCWIFFIFHFFFFKPSFPAPFLPSSCNPEGWRLECVSNNSLSSRHLSEQEQGREASGRTRKKKGKGTEKTAKTGNRDKRTSWQRVGKLV